jgi:hypothetical protein
MPKSKEVSVSGSKPTVHLESLDEGTIAVLTLDDSEGTNVMSPEMGDVFRRHIAFIQNDSAVKAVIIRGTGKDFSIGGLNVLHLRAAYFMENNLAAIGMIHGMGIFGNALLPDLKVPMAATRDVGGYAAQRLLHLDFSGRQTRELLGERDLSMTEVTAVIARGIDKPDVRYEQFSYDQVQQVLTQEGIPPKGAAMYIEMYKAVNAGVLVPQEPRSPENTTPTSFENFIRDVFEPAYHGKARTP